MDMTESILTSIKKLLGIEESYTHFDPDLIMHINSVFSILRQMGVGPAEGFAIADEDQEWKDFLGGNPAAFSFVRTYMHLKVKLIFDPPLSSAAIDAINQQIKELEWRLYVEADQQSNQSGEEDLQNGTQ